MTLRLQERLKRFFSPDGRSEPLVVEVASRSPGLRRPLFTTLAGAGLAALVAITSAGEAYAEDRTIVGAFLRGLLGKSASPVTTTSPNLGVFTGNLNEQLGLTGDDTASLAPVTIMALDFRDDSWTFARGLGPEGRKLFPWEKVSPMAAFGPSEEIGRLQAADGTVSIEPLSCLILVGGPQFVGSIKHKMATILGMHSAPESVKEKLDVGIGLDDYFFDKFIFYHELAHCLDKARLADPDPGDPPARTYLSYQRENRADVFALLMMARELQTNAAFRLRMARKGNALEALLDAGRSWANARHVRTLYEASLVPMRQTESFLKRTSWGAHYTVDSVDHALELLQQDDLERLEDMSVPEVFMQAMEITDQASMDPATFDNFRRQVVPVGADHHGEIQFWSDILEHHPAFLERSNRALLGLNLTTADISMRHVNELVVPFTVANAEDDLEETPSFSP